MKLVYFSLILVATILLAAFLMPSKSPAQIIKDAKLKYNNLTTYKINSQLIISVNAMGQDISTFQNVTYAKHNKNYLVKMSYQMPFTDYTVFSENLL